MQTRTHLRFSPAGKFNSLSGEKRASVCSKLQIVPVLSGLDLPVGGVYPAAFQFQTSRNQKLLAKSVGGVPLREAPKQVPEEDIEYPKTFWVQGYPERSWDWVPGLEEDYRRPTVPEVIRCLGLVVTTPRA